MHQLDLAKALTDRLQALKGSPSPDEAQVIPNSTEETAENTVEAGPILDIAELPKAAVDFEVRVQNFTNAYRRPAKLTHYPRSLLGSPLHVRKPRRTCGFAPRKFKINIVRFNEHDLSADLTSTYRS